MTKKITVNVVKNKNGSRRCRFSYNVKGFLFKIRIFGLVDVV